MDPLPIREKNGFSVKRKDSAALPGMCGRYGGKTRLIAGSGTAFGIGVGGGNDRRWRVTQGTRMLR